MKAAIYYGVKDIRVEDIEKPEITADDILIKVYACGICGTDLHGYRKGLFTRTGWILGHEVVGTVTDVGSNVKGIKIGDRVAPNTHAKNESRGCGECFWCSRRMPWWCEKVTHRPCGKCESCKAGQFWMCKQLLKYQGIGYSRNGGYSEYVRISNAVLNNTVYKIPNGMSFEEAALLEPLQGAIEWTSLAEPQKYETAVVLGAGPIGNCVMQVLKQTVSRVIVSDISPRRLKLAAELGADVAVDATQRDIIKVVADLTGVGKSYSGRTGARADIAMECAGTPVTWLQAIDVVRSGGKVMLLGLFEAPVTFNPNSIIHKPVQIISSFENIPAASETDYLAKAIELISSGKVNTDKLVTHTFPLEQIEKAFETQMRPDEAVKVLIKP